MSTNVYERDLIILQLHVVSDARSFIKLCIIKENPK